MSVARKVEVWHLAHQTRVPGFKSLPPTPQYGGLCAEAQPTTPQPKMARLRTVCRDAVSDTVMSWEQIACTWCPRTSLPPHWPEAYKQPCPQPAGRARSLEYKHPLSISNQKTKLFFASELNFFASWSIGLSIGLNDTRQEDSCWRLIRKDW